MSATTRTDGALLPCGLRATATPLSNERVNARGCCAGGG